MCFLIFSRLNEGRSLEEREVSNLWWRYLHRILMFFTMDYFLMNLLTSIIGIKMLNIFVLFISLPLQGWDAEVYLQTCNDVSEYVKNDYMLISIYLCFFWYIPWRIIRRHESIYIDMFFFWIWWKSNLVVTVKRKANSFNHLVEILFVYLSHCTITSSSRQLSLVSNSCSHYQFVEEEKKLFNERLWLSN